VQETVGTAPWINGLVSAVLLGLATTLVLFAVRAWREPAPAEVPKATALER
jgi:hypothetical protein